MIRKLLATTALTAFAATGAFAQGQAPHEITVQPGDTIIIEAERENANINLQLHSGAAGTENQTPEQARGEDGVAPQTEAMDRSQFEATDLTQISADDLMGTDVYSAQDENIGSVNDVLITEDGEVDAVLVDIGGFLGMGAQEVALGMDDLELMADADGNLYVYTPYTQDQLEGAPAYDQATWAEQRDEQRVTGEWAAQQPAQDDDMAATQQDGQMAANETEAGMDGEHVIADGGTVMIQSEETNFQLNFEIRLAGREDAQVGEANEMDQQATQAEPGVDGTETAAVNRDGMESVDMGQLRADDLIGSDVYGANDNSIGNVGDILLTEEGSFDAIIVDVGGFLGMGTREVALGLDNVEFMRDQNENWYVYTGYTQEQLEAAPEYDDATYAEQRDQQRVVPQ
ncbi:MAG: PRC-barrel domain-containing protein [Mesorhizobium sp.]|nr:PRC-barrel domain-containing protein [Mesorhizobium sp.]